MKGQSRKPGFKIRISTMLILSFVCLSLLPILITGTILARDFTTSLSSLILEKNQAIITSLVQDVESFQGQQVSMLTLLRNLGEDSPADRLRIMETILSQNPQINRIYHLSWDGRVQQTVPSQQDLIGLDLSYQPYIRHAMADQSNWTRGGVQWSNTFLSPDEGTPAVAATIGAPSGLYSFTLDLSILNNFLYSQSDTSREFAFILDERGTFIAHPQLTPVLQREDFRGNPGVRELLQDSELRIARHQDEGYTVLLERLPDIGWIAGYNQPLDVARGSAADFQQTTLLFAALFLLITLASNLILVSSSLKPISNLAYLSQRIRQGDYGVAVPSSRLREVSVVSDNFRIMVDAIRERERDLRDFNATLEDRVALRTRELNQSLEDLRHAQNQLIVSEKMAALGQLVAGVAHEMNTPLGVSVTALSSLIQELHTLRQDFDQGSIRRSQMEEFLAVGGETAAILESNINRAVEIVTSLKLLAVDQNLDEWREFNLREYLDRIVFSLSPELKKQGAVCELQCPQDVKMRSFPGALSQVVTNLVMNSLVHAFGDRISVPRIWIMCTSENGRINIEYRDNGLGLGAADPGRIFDPFYTTKRGGGGTGLGLNIVYNLVTNRLRGQVRYLGPNNPGLTTPEEEAGQVPEGPGVVFLVSIERDVTTGRE
ncbi:sensor histidine kinase [Spirochaeta lutea]|uniref:sensor histidine kinase n=1 Tax=Spirochaeta lutea TaxID=1480694 RepID=UPI00068D0DDB|nr:cache domain-containing protein [Spirochaeta lutea]